MFQTFNFRKAMQSQGFSQRTMKEYQRRVSRWYRYVSHKFGATKLFQMTKQEVIDYQAYLLGADCSKRTVNSNINAIKTFYRLAAQYNLVKHNPVDGVVYLKTSIPDTPRLSKDQTDLLKSWFDTLRPNARAGFYAMYGAGLRVGEASHLVYSDVAVKNGTIYLNIRDAKYASDRNIPIMDQRSAKVVYQYLKHEEPSAQPFFHLKRKTFQWYAGKFAKTHNMEFHCHMLRHNFATKLYEKGVAIPKIQKLLGHKSALMTFYYTRHANQNLNNIVPNFNITRDSDDGNRDQEAA